MEDSFKVRVDRVFGSLFGSIACNPPLSSLSSSSTSCPWTLSDAEVERKKWNREKGDSSPFPDPDEHDAHPSRSPLSGFSASTSLPEKQLRRECRRKSSGSGGSMACDLGDLDDEDDEKERNRPDDDYEKEDFEIRNGIGLDCTLDYEDEEDEYDKVAVGRENAGDRMYMRDITDYGPYVNYHNIVPDSFEEVKMAGRDPRANHLAAKARLQEDEEAAAGSCIPLQDIENKIPALLDSKAIVHGGGGTVKPILKRKDSNDDSKPKKRVRFNTGCEDERAKQSDQPKVVDQSMDCCATVNEASGPWFENTSLVPDYIRNPSKYTRYSFDTSKDDDESNQRAYQDFRRTMEKMSASSPPEPPASPPRSVTFTPRRKASGMNDGYECKQFHEDTVMVDAARRMTRPIGIAAEAHEDELCSMEEDEMPAADELGAGFQKSDRKYRSKLSLDS